MVEPSERLFEHTFPNEVKIEKSIPYENFFQSSSRNEPALVFGASQNWAARNWTPELLSEKWGTASFKLKTGERFSMAEYVAAMRNANAETPYAFSLGLRDIDPTMLADLQPQPDFSIKNWVLGPPLLRRLDLLKHGHFELLFGAANSTFPSFHFDIFSQHAFVFQLYGKKEVLFIKPEDGNKLKKSPEADNKLLIDPALAQDSTALSQFDDMTVYRAKLNPGDTIFVPARWWHAVTNRTESIAVTVSTVDRSNWRRYANDIKIDTDQSSRIKFGVKVAMLEAWGWFCRATR